MSRRDRHPVDPSRRRRIEDPTKYAKGKRDGQERRDQQKPKDGKPKDHGGAAYEVAITVGAIAVLVVLVLVGVAAINEIKGW